MLTWYACGSAAHQSMPRKAVPIDLLARCLDLPSLRDLVEQFHFFSSTAHRVGEAVDGEARKIWAWWIARAD